MDTESPFRRFQTSQSDPHSCLRKEKKGNQWTLENNQNNSRNRPCALLGLEELGNWLAESFAVSWKDGHIDGGRPHQHSAGDDVELMTKKKKKKKRRMMKNNLHFSLHPSPLLLCLCLLLARLTWRVTVSRNSCTVIESEPLTSHVSHNVTVSPGATSVRSGGAGSL